MPFDILSQIDHWKKELLDFSKRNRLVNCRIGGRNTLELRYPSLENIFSFIVEKEKPLFFPWTTDLVNVNSEDEEQIKKITFDDLLKSPELDTNEILTELSDKELNTKLKRKHNDAKESQEEHGINILYLGFGLLKWFESANSDVEMLSPLYLVPIQLSQNSIGQPWKISPLDDEAIVNHSLYELLKNNFALNLSQAENIESCDDFNTFLDSVQQSILQTGCDSRWEIQRRVVLECFNFQKLAMYKDLEANKEKIAEHGICRLIAGDDSAYTSTTINIQAEELDEKVKPLETFSILDSDSSQQLAIQTVLGGSDLALDGPPGTGKSQTIANIIAEMLGKRKTVLFVSEKAAAMEVVKKRLDNVNLGDFVLNCHTLLKKNTAAKKGVVGELMRCLELRGEQYSDQRNELNELYELRQKLNSYANILHTPLSALNYTPYQVHSIYAKYWEQQTFRSPFPNPFEINSIALTELSDCFDSLAKNPAAQNPLRHPWRECLLTNISFRINELQQELSDVADHLQEVITAVNLLQKKELLPENMTLTTLKENVAKLLPVFSKPFPVTRSSGELLISGAWFAAGKQPVNEVYQKYKNYVETENRLQELRRNLPQLKEWAFTPDGRKIAEETQDLAGIIQRVIGFFTGKLSTWKKSLKKIYRELPPKQQIFEDAEKLLDYFEQKDISENAEREFQKVKSDFDLFFPRHSNVDETDLQNQLTLFTQFVSLFPKSSEINRHTILSSEQFNTVRSHLKPLVDFFNGNSLKEIQKVFPFNFLSSKEINELHGFISSRAKDIHLLKDYLVYKNSLAILHRYKLDGWINEIEANRVPPESLKTAFIVRFYRDWLTQAYMDHPVLSQFDIDEQTRLIARFRESDKKFIRNSKNRLRQILLNDSSRNPSEFAPASSDEGILRAEFNKKRKLMSVRQLFSRIHSLIIRIKPCLMMSPLTVSTYLANVPHKFDLIIFDEASQIRPHDAITVIYRGEKLLVAGDQKQLPPTKFFEKMNDETTNENDDENDLPTENMKDYESVLDVLSAKLPRKQLRWHYRSRREPLIAFSNRNFYENKLVTFPSAENEETNPAVKFEFVENGCWKTGGSGGFNQKEAEHAAKLIMHFLKHHPQKSLGVITLNQRHQEAVNDELDKLRELRPDLEHFFTDNADSEKNEPFFVKNLENVQGDERDYIFLCIGYGKTTEGKMSMNFGPLNRQGGERRLNVAVTRAKYGLTVISSIRYTDINTSRISGIGPVLLRNYLKFAECGVSGLGAGIYVNANAESESLFEKQVAQSLINEGFNVQYQIGCSGYRIDLALTDPQNPGRFVLGIECDGAMYHSSKTARDRDRLRQEVLEGLGWTIYRIWSTDWIQNPAGQIEKIKHAFEQSKNRLASVSTKRTDTEQTEQPIYVEKSDPFAPKYNYAKIDDIPLRILQKTLIDILSKDKVSEEELLQLASKILGFARLGSKIRKTLLQQIKILQSKQQIQRDNDERLFINKRVDV
ncbi:MAG: DUF4011 domain-containing protein [Planctomycetaceae bacterium]|jgi:very-short-patch-repair endonuclease|nr:DUF4011 domain-containing protein [Planctomycetaceae bacterium]